MATTEPEPGADPLPASLPELMDALLGSDPADPLEEAGDACSAFVALFPDARHGSQLIATYFWWSLWHSLGDHSAGRVLGEVLRRCFDRGLDGKVEPVVVAHANGTRFSLLLLDPGYRGEPKAVVLKPDRRERFVRVRPRGQVAGQDPLPGRRVSVADRLVQQAVRHEFGHTSAIQDTPAAAARGLTTRMVAKALSEVCRSREFGIVLAGSHSPVPLPEPVPGLVFDAEAADPPLGLRLDSSDGPVATVGYVVSRGERTVGVTARHVFDLGALADDGEPVEVISEHEPTDTCVVLLKQRATPPGNPHEPMLNSTPRLFDPTPQSSVEAATGHFHGAASGTTNAAINGYHPDVVHPRTTPTATRILTAAALATGDPGSALVHQDGCIVGIGTHRVAVRLGRLPDGTAEGVQVPAIDVNTWSWMIQVLTVHELL